MGYSIAPPSEPVIRVVKRVLGSLDALTSVPSGAVGGGAIENAEIQLVPIIPTTAFEFTLKCQFARALHGHYTGTKHGSITVAEGHSWSLGVA